MTESDGQRGRMGATGRVATRRSNPADISSPRRVAYRASRSLPFHPVVSLIFSPVLPAWTAASPASSAAALSAGLHLSPGHPQLVFPIRHAPYLTPVGLYLFSSTLRPRTRRIVPHQLSRELVSPRQPFNDLPSSTPFGRCSGAHPSIQPRWSPHRVDRRRQWRILSAKPARSNTTS